MNRKLGNIENNNSKNKCSKKINMKVISFIILFIFFLTFFSIVIFVYKNKINLNTYKNIYLLEENIENMSYEQLREHINSLNQKDFKIDVYQNETKIYTILKSEINFKIDENLSLQNAFSIGRDGNLFINNFEILKLYFSKKYIDINYTYDEEKLDEIIKNIELSINDTCSDDKYYLEGDKLIIIRGHSGYKLNIDEEKNRIITMLKSSYIDDGISNDLKLNLEYSLPEQISVEKLKEKVKCEPVDAKEVEELGVTKFIASKVGYNFDEEKLNEILEKSKKEDERIEFQLDVIEPKVNIEDLDYAFYKNKLSGYTTYVSTPNAPKAKNMQIALNVLNEVVVMPGEVFSYNNTIGEVSASKGYVEAPTYKGGTTVNEIGGGICQTVSTLYNAVLRADLEIVERYQHGLAVSYVEPSTDATVYSPSLDFKFKNTRNFPIKIVTNYSNGTVNINIYGTYEETEYDISVESEKLSTIKYDTRYIYDDTQKKGEEQVVTYGMDGYTSQAYKIKSLNGIQISKELLSKDTYNPQTQVIKIGTKE